VSPRELRGKLGRRVEALPSHAEAVEKKLEKMMGKEANIYRVSFAMNFRYAIDSFFIQYPI
jgi:hypothetical protein